MPVSSGVALELTAEIGGQNMETPWRLQLTSYAVVQLDILSGKHGILAAWSHDGSVSYYALENGSRLGEGQFVQPKTTQYNDEQWKAFLPTLKGPQGMALPRIRTDQGQIWTADGGATAVMYVSGPKLLYIKASDGSFKTYGYDVTPAALAVDPKTYTAVALDFDGVLMIARPNGSVKTLKMGLEAQIDLALSVKISRGGERIALSDGMRLVVADGGGKQMALRELSYACSLVALSQDGSRVLTYDSDSGVVRSYRSDDLVMTHQRFVSDLMISASTVQLLDDLPSSRAALSALTCDGEGHVAFAVMGHVCAASLEHLKLKNMSQVVAAAPEMPMEAVLPPAVPSNKPPVNKKSTKPNSPSKSAAAQTAVSVPAKPPVKPVEGVPAASTMPEPVKPS